MYMLTRLSLFMFSLLNSVCLLYCCYITNRSTDDMKEATVLVISIHFLILLTLLCEVSTYVYYKQYSPRPDHKSTSNTGLV